MSTDLLVTIPDGFQQVDSGDQWPEWDFEQTPSFVANVISRKNVVMTDKKGGKKSTCLMVIDVDHNRYTLWQSAGLSELFKFALPGDAIWVHYKGEIELDGGRNPMKAYDTGINPRNGEPIHMRAAAQDHGEG